MPMFKILSFACTILHRLMLPVKKKSESTSQLRRLIRIWIIRIFALFVRI